MLLKVGYRIVNMFCQTISPPIVKFLFCHSPFLQLIINDIFFVCKTLIHTLFSLNLICALLHLITFC